MAENFTIFKKNNLASSEICCNFAENIFDMKRKPYQTDDSTLDINMASEPEMAYTYANQNDCETMFIGKSNSVEGFAVDEITSKPQKILQPDDDLRRAITMDELRESVHEHIRKLFAKK
jgi:hypothetical protein